jgi:predicted glycosyl hydrolase (DUF1957 family)
MTINGILLELFEKHGHGDVIDMIDKLLARKQIELTGSAKYHPFLPFLPEEEIIRQIKLNEETLHHYFGPKIELKGFFPPEMGFSTEIARTVAKLGYEWIIADELSFPRNQEKKCDRIYQIEKIDNFFVFFRERRMSWIILSGQVGTGELLIKSLGERLKKNEYLITAMDGETFGHHRPGLEMLLFEIYKSKEVQAIKISDLPKLFPKTEKIEPVASTWALMEKDLEKKKPFSRWNDEDNPIQKKTALITKMPVKSWIKHCIQINIGGRRPDHGGALK